MRIVLKIFILFGILSLSNCRPIISIQKTDGIIFWDNLQFKSSSFLGTSYTYEFNKSNYTLSARVNDNNEFLNYLVENGSYHQDRNTLYLNPKRKICYNLGKTSNKELIVTYETNGLEQNYIYVSADTLSKAQITNLRFNERKMHLEKRDKEIVLISGIKSFFYKQ